MCKTPGRRIPVLWEENLGNDHFKHCALEIEMRCLSHNLVVLHLLWASQLPQRLCLLLATYMLLTPTPEFLIQMSRAESKTTCV